MAENIPNGSSAGASAALGSTIWFIGVVSFSGANNSLFGLAGFDSIPVPNAPTKSENISEDLLCAGAAGAAGLAGSNALPPKRSPPNPPELDGAADGEEKGLLLGLVVALG